MIYENYGTKISVSMNKVSLETQSFPFTDNSLAVCSCFHRTAAECLIAIQTVCPGKPKVFTLGPCLEEELVGHGTRS